MSSPRYSPSPTSSPSSSPPLGPCDSSPASSPVSRPLSLSPPSSPGVAHPFAASTKAIRQPRIYEKRVSYGSSVNDFDDADVLGPSSFHTSAPHPALAQSGGKSSAQGERNTRQRTISVVSTSSTEAWLTRPPRTNAFQAPTVLNSEPDINLSDDDENKELPTTWKSHAEHEQAMWDAAINVAFEKADGIIDLSQEGLIGGHGLTRIPPSVSDLNNLVILPNTDTSTSTSSRGPPVTYPRERIFSRSRTVPATHPGDGFLAPTSPRLAKLSSLLNIGREATSESPVNALRMYLNNNTIRTLPPELFTLRNLAILNLRNNRVSRIPPEIANLPNLRQLVIAQNKLTYLPAEMLSMHLDQLTLTGNPWMKPSPTLEGRRPVSETTVLSAVPSLTECCLRKLVSPYVPPHTQDSSTHTETILEALGGISSATAPDYPPHVIRILRACVPDAVAQPDPEMQASPSKRARRSSGASSIAQDADDDDEEATRPIIGYCRSPVHGDERSPFVQHAVERFSWETVIAGQRVPVTGGVPVLWRGCLGSCLNFLDAALEAGDNAKSVE